MKRAKHLFEQITSFENLLLAARKAQRGKRFTPPVAHFNHNLEYELFRLQDQLIDGTYRPGKYRVFYINDPKHRMISAAPYRDRVVHHAICNIVEPIYERSFITDSYASRKNKGTHVAVRRLTRFMQSHDYLLKCDIRKYFPSIDHAILKELLRRKIGCQRTLQLLDLVIDHSNPQETVNSYFPGDNLFTPLERAKGLPIGNQTSQFFANVYLDALDHFIKERCSIRGYIRFADDFVVMGNDRAELWQIRNAIQDFLASRLRLELHPNKQWVQPVTIGVDFLGYVVFPTHRLLRRVNGYRFARRLGQMAKHYGEGKVHQDQLQRRVSAWLGHACHADTYGLRRALFASVSFRRASSHRPV